MCGLHNDSTFLVLGDVVCTYFPSFVFLSETKIPQKSALWIRVRLGFMGYFSVDSKENNGGFCLLWS